MQSFYSMRPQSNLNRLRELMYPVIPTKVFETYWLFAFERQNIFFRRLRKLPSPWTKDSILAQHRFTNTYRVLDRVSQYLLRSVQYNKDWDRNDLFFRTLLFKIFNRIDTWKEITARLGEPRHESFSVKLYSNVLEAMMQEKRRIYSAAYIMPSGGPNSEFHRKYAMHLNLLTKMMQDKLPAKIAGAKNMAESFRLLVSYPTIGNFLGYQFVTDLNYSQITNFSEQEFVVAGPGAKEGIEKCFSDFRGKDYEWIIRRTMEIQDRAFEILNVGFSKIPNRDLQLIDCQNIFCEVAKYARIKHPEYNASSGRTRIKQNFRPLQTHIDYFFPPKWNVVITNQRLCNVAHI